MSIEILSSAFPGNWKQHPEFKLYFFCQDGRVASVIKGKPRLLIGTKCGQYGYRAIPVYANRRGQKIYTHRTICELFNGPPAPGQQCRHLDGDKTNNAASNLRWGSAKENSDDRQLHGTMGYGEANSMSKLTNEQVAEIRRRVDLGETQRSMCKIFNVSPMTISRVVRKETWK
jgi:hypothetical protein